MTKDQVFGSKAKVKTSEVSVADGSKFVGAVFKYVFLALAITSLIAALMGALFNLALFKNSEAAAEAFVRIFVVALIAYIPTLLWAHLSARRNGPTMNAAFVTYSAVMGVFVSSFTLLVPFYIIAIAFGLTCLTFGLMALIAWNSKKNLSTLGVIASGLFFGALMMILFNVILGFFISDEGMLILSWLLSFIILISVILITVFDLNNVKRIAQSGGGTKNVALMCALNLYVDFIYIFIRILSLIVKIKNK